MQRRNLLPYNILSVDISRGLTCLYIVVFVLGINMLVVADSQLQPTRVDAPAHELDLSRFGFRGLSTENRFLRASNVSVTFLNNEQVLFTFNPKKLFQRLPECPPSHKDRIIQAQVIELSSGRVLRETSWYVHDERRYLWPLDDGRVMLRRLNSLYEIGPNLTEKLLFHSPKQLLWTSVTPDGKQIIVETAVDEKQLEKEKAKGSAKTDVAIEFLDSRSLAVQRTIRVSKVVPLNGTSLGFADAVHNISGKIWLVRFGPGSKDRTYITRVKSRCVPDLQFPTNNTIFVGRCSAETSDYSVSVFTLTGHFLWREKWSERRYEPAIERSADSSRVAISTIAGIPGAQLGASDSETLDEEQWPQVEQIIKVVDAATGKTVLSTKTEPVLKGQNFTLSADASRMAVLDGPRLKIFDLPAMSTEDRTKYLAMQADAPALVAPASRNPGENAEEVFDVADNSDQESPKAAPVAAPTPGVQQQAPAAAQTNAASDGSDNSTITFKTSSKTVVVDVVVTDSKGHPARGLSAQDFQLQEDGKPQRVNYFHEFVGNSANTSNTPAVEQISAADPAPSPNVFTNNQLSREDEPVTVFLLDLLNTPPQAQWFAKQELIKFLKNKPKSSQFALCALSNSLHLIQGFTNDEALLIATANGKKGGTRWSPLIETDRGLNMGTQMQKDVAGFDASKQFVVQMFEQAAAEEKAEELDRRVSITTDAFAQLARYLSGVPGRKNVVWLSASFPLGIFPNNDLFNAFSESRSYADVLKRTANLLAEAHVAVYPVDVRGLMTQSLFAASSNMNPAAPAPGSLAPIPGGAGSGSLANTAANAQAPNPMMQDTHESLEDQVGDQSTMDQIASDTGGKAFYNTNGITEAIQTAVEQGTNYYMLSYTPANRNYDGRFRKIKLTLASKGYHVAYRRGYFADHPAAPLKQEKDALSRDVGLAAMQHGSPQSHQIVFATRVVPVGKPTKVDPAKQSASQARKRSNPSSRKCSATLSITPLPARNFIL